MTILTKEKLQHLNSITHEGKVVVVATDADGKIWYTVKQDGFEDSYLNQPANLRTGWENWQELEFPNENDDDDSVTKKETAELTYKTDTTKFVIKSRYRTKDQTAVAPVQLVSALGHIYLFRQSKTNTLLVDRFVLDGMTNKLNRKLEVRFKRSRQKHAPTKNMTKGANGLQNIDSLDFRDANGLPFYEPSTELCTIGNLQKGWFAVVLVPTIENDIYRWHIFAYNSQTQKVELTTLRASDEGLFEVKDYTLLEESDNGLLPRSIPGVIKRTLDIGSVTINNGLAATKYDLQQSQMTQSGREQLLKTATRLMLAVPTTTGTAALSFAIAADGTLAQINETPVNTIIRSNQREVLLPLNTLDEIKAFGDRTPPPQGIISGFSEGTKAENAEDLVKISTNSQAAGLADSDLVKITGTKDYQGLYSTRKIDDNTFEINIATGTELGYWEKQEEEGGLIFDGMITAYQKTADGKLHITCANHGLENGDQVQISGTQAYNDTYPVKKIDDTHFVIERKWATGEAVNVRLVALKRRGIVFDGVDDYVEIPYSAELNPSKFTVTCWAKVTGGQGTYRSVVTSRDIKTSNSFGYIIYAGDNNKWQFWLGNNTQNWIKVTGSDIVLNQWTHIAATFDGSTAKLYINGIFAAQLAANSTANTARPLRIGTGGTEGTAQYFFSGQIADVLIWNLARTETDIKNNMYLQLTGKEVGLVGYWRLGGISEGKVVGFTDNGNDGTVYSDPYVGAMTLNRKLGDNTTDAVKYSNSELIAISQRATYQESFEFKVNSSTAVNLAYLDNADGRNLGTKIFTLSYWGKTSRSAEEKKPITTFVQNVFEDAGGGWFRVSANVTIPDGVSMLRSFEIANVKGTWTSLEIRKHRIQLLSDSITEAKYTDSVNLTTLANNQTALVAKLAQLEVKEQQEAVLLLEKKELDAKIAAYIAQASTRERIAVLESNIVTYTTEEANLLSQYNSQKDNLFNKCFYISVYLMNENHWTQLRVQNNSDANDTPLVQTWSNDLRNLCKLVEAGSSNYYLEIKVGSSWKRLTVRNNSDGDDTNLTRNTTGNIFQLINAGNGNYCLNIQVGSSWKGVHVYNQYGNEGNSLVRHRGNGNPLKFNYIDEPANDKVAVAQAAWQAKTQQITNARTELALLRAAITATASDKAAWDTRLVQLNSELTTIQAAIDTINTEFINGVTTTQATPQTMPQVAKDGKGLVTQGAILGFVQSASRLNAIETCEGNVQLSYFDTQGRMQQTNYDATADANNAAFEQWIPNSLRACLNLTNNSSQIQLTSPFALSDESTVETWFCFPSGNSTLKALLGSPDGSSPVVIKDNSKLGTRTNGIFFDSGYDLALLTSGWHHLAAVGKGVNQNATTTFYIDGKKVGETKSFTALEFDGVDDCIEVAPHTNPTTAITVALWAKSSTDNWNAPACLASKRDAYILSPTQNSKQITFQVYAGGSWRSISYTPSNISEWHHYAGTFDGQTVKLYIDGVQVPSNNPSLTTTTAINSDSGSLYIGKDDGNSSYFKGQIAEVSVWNSALLPRQIQTNMGKLLEGRELGLVGYWRFTANSATDLSPSQKNGIFQGQPKAVYLLAKATSTIEVIGNSKTGSQQFGKLSEFRIWRVALNDNELAANSKTLLSGNEPGLAAYYPLNEATGTTVRDNTGSGNGTVVGTWWGCNALIGKLENTALKFDGVNDHISLPNLNPDFSQGFTVEAWVWYDSFKNQSRIIELANNPDSDNILLGNYGTSTTLQMAVYRGSAAQYLSSSEGVLETGKWLHIAATIDAAGNAKIYKNGQEVKSGTVNRPNNINRTRNYLGRSSWSSDGYFDGKMSEVRIWKVARTKAEIQANMSIRLTGTETNLVAYYRLDEIITEGTTRKVLDRTANNYHGTVTEAVVNNDSLLPVVGTTPGKDALICNEYSTINLTPNGKVAIMRRFFAYPDTNAAILFPDKRVEELELKWIGNAQFAPTLLGYIEGAPPVPTENLTLSDDYNGASSVELTISEDVAFSWNRSQDSGLGASTEIFAGADAEMSAGFAVSTKIARVRAGFTGNFDFSYQFQNESNITSSSSLSMTDKLELRGTPEITPKFSHIGNRFIPKNVGYALVVSALADVFITRLARSGKMVGYQVQPVDGIPPDVNTITFLMNPAYTMNGSLDGLTGSSATSDRFFKHVPQMRAQYGSLYPASYYRLQEAYNLKQAIEKEDKRRESYFDNFDVRTIDETSLGRNIDSGNAPTSVGVEREEDKPSTRMTEEEKRQAEEQKAAQLKTESAGLVKQQSAATEAKQAEIQSKIDDQDQRLHAQTSFAGWQKRMEDIQIKAGKRNIVNTYVWDADGGLRTEAQSFANTVEHTIGGSFGLNAGLGFEGKFGGGGAAVELTAQATINMTQTMNKTESRSRGIQLNIDLSGVEFRGITNYNDLPILPGEKVDRYRFMSFYLEGTTQNFQDFFSYVVDPEWLASNDEEARALRQTRAGKPNKAWRVLHRVTYVERPALMGFGRDLRQGGDIDPATQEILNYFTQLQVRHQELKNENLNLKNQINAVQRQLVDSTQALQSKLDQILLKINPH